MRISTTGTGGDFSPCWTVFGAAGVGPTPAGDADPGLRLSGDALFPNAGAQVIRVSDAGDDATGSLQARPPVSHHRDPDADRDPDAQRDADRHDDAARKCDADADPHADRDQRDPDADADVDPDGHVHAVPRPSTPTPTTHADRDRRDADTDAQRDAVRYHDVGRDSVGDPASQSVGDPGRSADGSRRSAGGEERRPLSKVLTSTTGKLIASRLKRLDACATRVLGCVQTKPGEISCNDKAVASCARGIAKLGADEAKMRASIVKACGALSASDRGSAAGLGFDTTVAFVSGRRRRDAARGLHGHPEPLRRRRPDDRRGAPHRRAAAPGGHALEPGACLDDFGGGGAGAGDPKTVGGPVLQCAKAVTRAARTLARRPGSRAPRAA